ncbi:MAG: hypothetical protein QOD61_1323 [Solirubrobacteraceae bacterium]|nr:hypothetical protein [Solirubrobacteraceae bacterium]
MAIVDLSTKVPADWETALGFLIAFYYGLTGVACAVCYGGSGAGVRGTSSSSGWRR